MSLVTLSSEDKARAKAEVPFLLTLLDKEYEEIKEALVDRPAEQLPELRGNARALRSIIKLLT